MLALAAGAVDGFVALCRRERCPFAVIGEAADDGRLVVDDAQLGRVRRRHADRRSPRPAAANAASARRARRRSGDGFDPETLDAARRPRPPAAPARDRRQGFPRHDRRPQRRRHDQPRSAGRALAGSRQRRRGHDLGITRARPARRCRLASGPPSQLLDAPASGRIAVGEAHHKHRGCRRARARRRQAFGELDGVLRRSCGGCRPLRHRPRARRGAVPGARHCDTGRQGLALDAIGLARADGVGRAVVAPLSLVVTACAPVGDVRRTLTPALETGERARPRSCSSTLAPARTASADPASRRSSGDRRRRRPTSTTHASSSSFFAAIRELRDAGLLLAYHDRSDGGLAITLLEMAFAGRAALDVDLGTVDRPMAALFAEELGAVLQIARAPILGAPKRCSRAMDCLRFRGASAARTRAGASALPPAAMRSSMPTASLLHAAWSETTWRMQRLRDEPACADEERDARLDASDPGPRLAARLRSGRGRRGAIHCNRRAAAGRDSARAGRQQPGRDGGSLRSCGIHGQSTST